MNISTSICLSVAALLAAPATSAQALPATPAQGTALVSAQSVMANNDLNKDGIITKSEAVTAGGRLAQAWDQYDLNKDGKVNNAELNSGLTAVQESAAESAQVTAKTAMTNNDLNKDGIITRAEAVKAGGRLAQAWDEYDGNKDGKVNNDELTKGLAAVQEGADAEQVKAALINNDLNKDGTITRAEATRANGRLAQAWDEYDLNKDGKVDNAELTRGIAAAQKEGAGAAAPSAPRPAAAAGALPRKN